MDCKIVLEDWRQHGNPNSVYSTPLGLELTSGDLHSGTTFHASLELPKETQADIQRAAMEHGAYPVFAVILEQKKEPVAQDTSKMTAKEAMGEREAIRREWAEHSKALDALRKRTQTLYRRCPHQRGHYHGDPAGGSDSWTECPLCGGEAT